MSTANEWPRAKAPACSCYWNPSHRQNSRKSEWGSESLGVRVETSIRGSESKAPQRWGDSTGKVGGKPLPDSHSWKEERFKSLDRGLAICHVLKAISFLGNDSDAWATKEKKIKCVQHLNRAHSFLLYNCPHRRLLTDSICCSDIAEPWKIYYVSCQL